MACSCCTWPVAAGAFTVTKDGEASVWFAPAPGSSSAPREEVAAIVISFTRSGWDLLNLGW